MANPANRVPERVELRLEEALIRWGDQDLIAAIGANERHLTPTDLWRIGFPSLCDAVPCRDKDLSHYQHEAAISEHYTLWDRLIRDWKNRIETEELFLTAVRVQPDPTSERRPVPGAWVSEFTFDVIKNTMFGMQQSYSAVRVSQHAPGSGGTNAGSAPGAAITPATFDVSTLSADDVAALLERHACFVRKDVGVNLLPPGKVSVIGLVATKMRDRGEAGELAETITEEARWLAKWGERVAPSYPVLSYKTIRNKLSELFKQLQQAKPPQAR